MRVFLKLLILFASVPAFAQVDPMAEPQIRAAYLLNFVKFIGWPSPPSEKLNYCIVQDNAVADALESAISPRPLRGVPIQVTRMARPTHPTDGCTLVFYGTDQLDQVNLRELAGRRVLTVGVGELFLERGGIIAFALDGDRMHFDVNMDAAVQAQLKFSSKLLHLARNLRSSHPR